MADHEPPATSQDFPERIRVHALAKLLGVTSKQVMAQLDGMGSPARSVQSSVVRADAEIVASALGSAPAAAETPLAETPAAEPVDVESAPPPPEAAFAAEPDLFTNIEVPVQSAPPETPTASVPLFLQPGEPEPAPARRRRARSRPQRDDSATSEATTSDDTPQTPAIAESAVETVTPADTVTADTVTADTVTADTVTADTTSDGTASDDDSSDASGSDTAGSDASDDSDSSGPRRRRRGRRGRGRGRGDQQNDESDDTTSADSAESNNDTAESVTTEVAEVAVDTVDSSGTGDSASETSDDDDSERSDADSEGDNASRRRRRRRRRKSGSDGSSDSETDDDPPNTVVHEREPRNKQRAPRDKDEVQGIAGSTRLEAKRQRRRDGRDAGRRRPPILTESEFLARREAVDRTMVVRQKALAGQPDLTQVAVMEDGVLVEHFVTSTSSGSISGNVYLGRVQNVLPSMEAAFIDIGKGRNGVLYAGEVDWEAAGLGGSSRKIEQALKPGDQVLVQVSKDPVGHKGARLTTQISLAGRFLVYVPGGSSTGISRKLPDTERKRLKDILRDIVPADAGVIIRTASEGVSAEELARDVTRLQAQWATISEATSKAESSKGSNPQSLYEEPDLLVKVVRDLFNEDFAKLVIEGDRAWSTVQGYIETVAPDMLARVERYEPAAKDIDVFAAHRIDEQLAKALDRKVWLPSGGTLVIDRTEAMTVVDVNTGKFTGAGGNLEETVTRNNLEAAEEVVRQMRLRDIGGMIVVDFIDMVLESNRDLVLRRLTEALGRDRTRHQVSEVTSLGLVQMTRKRMGTGLVEAFSTTCEHCHGRGIMVHQFPVELSSDDSGNGNGRAHTPKSDPATGNSRRRRGGRDKQDTRSDDTSSDRESSNADKDDAVSDTSARRPHPVALAMAAHSNADGSDPETVVEVAGNDPVTENPAESAAAAVAAVREVEAVAPEETSAPEKTLGSDELAVDVAPTTRPRRSRRVSRAASAPANAESSGTVIVVSDASPTESVPIEDRVTAPAAREASPVAVATRPKRRRAAARPAGPPVDET